MDKEFLKRLRKKKKSLLVKEQEALYLEQEALREERAALDEKFRELTAELVTEPGDEDKQKKTAAEIAKILEAIKRIDERLRSNTEMLECYSRILKNDREGRAAKTSANWGVITGLGGMLLGLIGLAGAFNSDNQNTLVNRHTLDWTKTLPIFKKKI